MNKSVTYLTVKSLELVARRLEVVAAVTAKLYGPFIVGHDLCVKLELLTATSLKAPVGSSLCKTPCQPTPVMLENSKK